VSLRGHLQGSATARRHGISRSLFKIWRREYRAGAFVGPGTSIGFVPLVLEDVASPRPQVPLAPAPVETIEIALTNGRRMTTLFLWPRAHLAALLAVLDPR